MSRVILTLVAFVALLLGPASVAAAAEGSAGAVYTLTNSAAGNGVATFARNNDDTLTYAQLETRSTQVARILTEGGCHKGDRICVLMPKCPAAIVCLLAIYKAGGVYVPLDPASPPARLEKILDSCDTRWLLAAGPTTRLLDAVFEHEPFRTSISIGWMDAHPPKETTFRIAFSIDDVRSQPVTPPVSRTTRRDPAPGPRQVPRGQVLQAGGGGRVVGPDGIDPAGAEPLPETLPVLGQRPVINVL